MIKLQRQRTKEKEERNFRAFGEMIRNARKARGEQPESDEEEIKYSKFSGEKIIDFPEHPLLKAAREKAEAQYCALPPPVPAGESGDSAEKAPPLPPAPAAGDDNGNDDEDLRDEQEILEEQLRGIGHDKPEDVWAYVDGKPNSLEKQLEKDIFHKSFKANEETKKNQPVIKDVFDAVKQVDPDAAAKLQALHKMQQEQQVHASQLDDDSFIPSDTFTGSKKGYVFHQGKQGLGYYIDKVQQPSDSPEEKEGDDTPPPLDAAPPLPQPTAPTLEATDLEALD